MMVKSLNTKNMTKAEIADIQESLFKASRKRIKEFRKEFNPDEMGFYGRKEGI